MSPRRRLVQQRDPRRLFEKDLQQAQALGNRAVEATLFESLASLAVMQGQAPDAIPLLERSLGIRLELGDPSEIAACLCNLARALAAVGQSTAATQLLSSFEALRAEIGGTQHAVAQTSDETRATLQSQLDASAFEEAWEQGQALTMDQAISLALESARAV